MVYHHRGAYLNALGNQMTWNMGNHPVYLWTLPMFHCNGWCYPWTITALAGVHVFLRRVDPAKILTLIRDEQVTHLCGAPIVLNALVNMPPEAKAAIDHPVKAMVAGAAPPAKVIGAVEEMGIHVTHVYGLTEVYGPVTLCAWHAEWDALPLDERAQIKARQGVRYPTLEGVMVGDPKTLEPVPRDGETIGEIFMRGNTVMKGYLKNPTATEEAFEGGVGEEGLCLAKTAKLCDAAAERGIGRRTVGFGKCPPRGDARLALRRLFCGGVHRLFPPHGGRRKVVQNHPAKIYKYNKRCGRKMQGFRRKCGCRFWADLV